MTGGIHHPNYRVIPAGFARGFWIGVCRVCPTDNRYQTAKNGTALNAEKALRDHLRDKHDINEAKEAMT